MLKKMFNGSNTESQKNVRVLSVWWIGAHSSLKKVDAPFQVFNQRDESLHVLLFFERVFTKPSRRFKLLISSPTPVWF